MILVMTEGTQARMVVFSVQRMKSIRLSKMRAISAQHHLWKNSYLRRIFLICIFNETFKAVGH